MNKLQHLIDKNTAWSEKIKKNNPEFFSKLSEEQTPEYLWIGCSDSRVPANQIVDLPPGEVFVHRNIANVVVHTDLNCLSVMQFAVEVLNVKHIIICGHYGCGGVRASLEDKQHGLIDNWLRHIQDVSRLHSNQLDHLDFEDKCDKLAELNVIEQVRNVCSTTIVQNAWNDNKILAVHGWIYSLHDGIIQNLNTSISSMSEFEKTTMM